MRPILPTLTAVLSLMSASASAQQSKYYEVPKGDFPHDVAAGVAGEVWYAGQKAGVAGRLDATTGQIERIALGKNSAPQGVIVGPDGAPWFTHCSIGNCLSGSQLWGSAWVAVHTAQRRHRDLIWVALRMTRPATHDLQ